MACNCGKRKSQTIEYVVTYPTGEKVIQPTELEAKKLATQVGGSYQGKTKQPA